MSTPLVSQIQAHLVDSLRNILTEESIFAAIEYRWKACSELVDELDPTHEMVDSFAAHLATKLNDERLEWARLATLHLDDLFWAYLCAQQNSRALRRFDREISKQLPLAFGNRYPQSDIDDVIQDLCEYLLVGKRDQHPKILDYKGTGRLYSWTRIACVRRMQNKVRGQKKTVSTDSSGLWEQLLPSGNAELEHIKNHYRNEFRLALQQAAESLTIDQRLLLRQHFIENLNSGQLASFYHVHRATVSRRIVAAQEALLDTTRHTLMTTLGLSTPELASVLRLLHSRFDTGMADLLGVSPLPDPDCDS